VSHAVLLGLALPCLDVSTPCAPQLPSHTYSPVYNHTTLPNHAIICTYTILNSATSQRAVGNARSLLLVEPSPAACTTASRASSPWWPAKQSDQPVATQHCWHCSNAHYVCTAMCWNIPPECLLVCPNAPVAAGHHQGPLHLLRLDGCSQLKVRQRTLIHLSRASTQGKHDWIGVGLQQPAPSGAAHAQTFVENATQHVQVYRRQCKLHCSWGIDGPDTGDKI
jgi:hypothetical protein